MLALAQEAYKARHSHAIRLKLMEVTSTILGANQPRLPCAVDLVLLLCFARLCSDNIKLPCL